MPSNPFSTFLLVPQLSAEYCASLQGP